MLNQSKVFLCNVCVLIASDLQYMCNINRTFYAIITITELFIVRNLPPSGLRERRDMRYDIRHSTIAAQLL